MKKKNHAHTLDFTVPACTREHKLTETHTTRRRSINPTWRLIERPPLWNREQAEDLNSLLRHTVGLNPFYKAPGLTHTHAHTYMIK